MAQAATKKRPAARADAPAGSAQAVRLPVVERTDILVKAVGRGDGVAGFYNLIRYRDGDTFFLNKEEDFSEKWMVAVDANREEIPEETERLTKLSRANSRKVAMEMARSRARVSTELDPDAELERAEKDLEKAKAEKPHRGAPAKRGSSVGVGENTDPNRKIAGTDYERHEDAQPTDNQGVEPQTGRASNRNVA